MVECEACLKWSHSQCVGLSEADATSVCFRCHICSTDTSPISSTDTSPISNAHISSLMSAMADLSNKISNMETSHGLELKAIKLHVISLEESNNRLVQELSALKKIVVPKNHLPRSTKPPNGGAGQQVNGRASSQLRGPSSFRIVWGTKFSCPTDFVKDAVLSLLPADTDMSVSIKKSIKLNSAGKKKWWLTILAPPECLSVINEKWDSLSCPSHWRLLSRLSDLGPPSGNPPLLGGDVPNEPDGPPSQNSISNPLVPSEDNPLSTHATPQDNLFLEGREQSTPPNSELEGVD